MIKSIFLTLLAVFSVGNAAMSGATAKYQLELRNTVDMSSIPDNIHFSPIVVFTHKFRYTKFQLYGYASPGVEDVCELGSTTKLLAELNEAKMDGLVGEIHTIPMVKNAGEAFKLMFSVNEEYSYLSFITMVAPSTDWIVGMSRFNLMRRNGGFKRSVVRKLMAYDCGTEDADGSDTTPVLNIAPLTQAPYDTESPGTVTLERM